MIYDSYSNNILYNTKVSLCNHDMILFATIWCNPEIQTMYPNFGHYTLSGVMVAAAQTNSGLLLHVLAEQPHYSSRKNMLLENSGPGFRRVWKMP